MISADIRENDHRQMLAAMGRDYDIDGRTVLAMLSEDEQANAAGRATNGAFEERHELLCMAADLGDSPIPQQVMTIDDRPFIVDGTGNIEGGLLRIRMRMRRV